MLNHYSRIIREVKPDIISMENVPQLKNTEPLNNSSQHLRKTIIILATAWLIVRSMGFRKEGED